MAGPQKKAKKAPVAKTSSRGSLGIERLTKLPYLEKRYTALANLARMVNPSFSSGEKDFEDLSETSRPMIL